MRRGVDQCGYRGEIRWRWERGFRTCCGGRLVGGGGGGVGLEILVLVVFHSSTFFHPVNCRLLKYYKTFNPFNSFSELVKRFPISSEYWRVRSKGATEC